MNNYNVRGSSPKKQEGAAVIAVVMVLLTVLTIIGITSAKTASIETKMTTNTIDRQKAFIAAGTAVQHAWNEIDSDFDVTSYVANCDQEGIYDLRAGASATCTTETPTASDRSSEPVTINEHRNSALWNGMKGPRDWKWQDKTVENQVEKKAGLVLPSTKLTSTLSFLTTAQKDDPMKLASAPQYATGIRSAIERKGTEGFYCIPVSVMGAGKGSTDQAQVLVEINAIPKSGCFRKKVE